MDSLLANYASSDDEEQDQSPQAANPQPPSKSTPSSASSTIFSSLPPPKSSLSSLLPLPKTHLPPANLSKSDSESLQYEVPGKPKSPSSIFSRLPPPKSQSADPFSLNSLPIAQPNPRKVVQLKLPVNPSMFKSRDSDDEDDEDKKEREGRKPSVETASVKSFLSSIPAPRNSSNFGVLPSAAGSGRRSILEADVPTIRSNDSKGVAEIPAESNLGTYDGQWAGGPISAPSGEADSSVAYAYGGAYGGNEVDASGSVSENANYENYDDYTSYENYSYSEQHDGNWGDASMATAAAAQSSMVQMNDSSVNIPRKRGRNDIPQDIIEVKQDELMKNRPREDQVKLTGIAFGPSYQPVSTKGKPSKLHKRKHQIGTLYFDMRQKEMELAERRSKGLLTKAETHAKYGW